MTTFGKILVGIASDIAAGDRLQQFEQGRYGGSLIGRGDGGFDAFDRNGRYNGKVVRSAGANGFDVYDGNGRFRETIKR